jgi:hypothetical protein
MTDDITIDDVLEDPEINGKNVPEEPIKEGLLEDNKDYNGLEGKIDDIIKDSTLPKPRNPIKDGIPTQPPIQPNVPMINDPDDLLAGVLQPAQIIQQTLIDPAKNDSLYEVINDEESTSHILNQVLKEIAEELAFLKASRKVAFIGNEDISDICDKRVKSLKTLVDTVLNRDKYNSQIGGKIDFQGDRFEKVVEFFLETVKGAFEKSGIPDQFNDIFFVQLAQDLEGFEKTVEKIYYNKSKEKR